MDNAFVSPPTMSSRSKQYKTWKDNKRPLVFQALDWAEEDSDEYEGVEAYTIRVYGVCEDGSTASVMVHGFQPFLHVAIPSNWTMGQADQLIDQLGNRSVAEHEIVRRQTFQGFQNGAKMPFLRVSFRTLRGMRFFQRRVEDAGFQCRNAPRGFRFQCWETRLPPFLRVVHKRNIGAAGWIQIDAYMYQILDEKSSNCTVCAAAEWTALKPDDRESIAPFVIAAMDIESDSAHGEFPLAKKDYRKCVVDVWNAASMLQRRFDYLGDQKQLSPEEEAERVRIRAEIQDPDDLFHSLMLEALGLAPSRGRIHALKLRSPADFCEAQDVLSEISREGLWRRLYQLRSLQAQRAKIPEDVLNGYKSAGDLAKYLTGQIAELLTRSLPPIEGDPVIQIGMTVHRYGEKDVFYRYIGTLRGCEPIEGAVVESFETERELLLAFAKRVQRVDPDILTGYNVFGFDWKYMWHRAEELGIAEAFSRMGRRVIPTREKKKVPIESKLIEKSLSSSALGDNFMYYIPMEGRVQLDLMKAVQGSYKLDSYKLDTVASQFMRGTVKKREDVIDEDGAGAWLTVDSVAKVVPGRFLQFSIDNGIHEDMWHAGEKVRVLEVRADPPALRVDHPMDDLPLRAPNKIKYCEVKDDIHPEDIFRLQKGTDADRCTIARYCLQDCELCNRLIDKLEIVANSIGMANVCLVPLSFLFFRGQGIKIFSLVAKQCSLEGYLIPPTKADERRGREDDAPEEEEREGYEGAIVLKAFTDIHYMPVSVADFNSLYPSCMISHNLSHDSIVLDPAFDNLPGRRYETVEYDNYVYIPKPGTKVVEKKINEREPKKFVRYVQPEVDAEGQVIESSRGIIPRILQRLLKARKDTRTKQKAFAKSDFRWTVLEGLQLAYKVTANSLYGQVGASTSPIYLKDIAASTTAVGRQNLVFAKDYVEANYPGSKAVYGDSVPGDTPVLLRAPSGCVHIESMETVDAFFGTPWTPYELFRNPSAYEGILDGLLDRIFGRDGPVPDMEDWRASTEEVPEGADAVWQTAFGRVVEWSVAGRRVFVDVEGWSIVRKHAWSNSTEGPVVRADEEDVTLASLLFGAQVLLQLPKAMAADLKKDRRVLVRNGNPLDLRSANLCLSGELTDDLRRECRENLRVLADNREEKEELRIPEGWTTWGKTGWTAIRRFIRHKTNKRIFRVQTGMGLVDVTEDHSLMDAEGNLVKPGDVGLGTALMHGFPAEFAETPPMVPEIVQGRYGFLVKSPGFVRPSYELTAEEAWVWGFFMADGSCGDYACASGSKSSWAINNQDLNLLNKAKAVLDRIETPHVSFQIFDTMKSSGIYKLNAVGCVAYIVKKYRPLFYTADKLKKVPTIVLNAPLPIRKAFFEGFYAGDGSKGAGQKCALVDGCYNPERPQVGQKGKVTCQGLYYLMRSLAYRTAVSQHSNAKEHCYYLQHSTTLSEGVARLHNFDTLDDYNHRIRLEGKKHRTTTADRSKMAKASADWSNVYDIETADGTFLGGVGSVICLQTDSVNRIAEKSSTPRSNNMTTRVTRL